MSKKILILITTVPSLLLMQLAAYALAWPNTMLRNTDIEITNVNRYEPSGLAYNPVTQKLFAVSDDGRLTRMNLDGTGQETVSLAYLDQNNGGTYRDFEAVTIVDPNSDKIYIGVENKDSIVELEWPEGGSASITKSWDLTGILNGPDNLGLEGLTFVPDAYHPFGETASGGLFYAAVQRSPVLNDASTVNDYLIYAFDIDLNAEGTTVVQQGDFYGIAVAPNTPTSDISDLLFSEETGVLYVLYDGANRLIEMNTLGEVLKNYTNVPVLDQEGLALVTRYPSETADVYLASDYFNNGNLNDPNNKKVIWLSGYPVTYSDLFNGVDPAPVPDPSPATLIQDAGFENYGTTGVSTDWRSYGIDHIRLTNEEVFEGDYALALDTIGGSGGVQQLGLPVEAGKTYRLTFNQKLLSGEMKVWFGVGTSNSDFEGSTLLAYPKGIWQPLVREITIPQVVEKNGVSYVNTDGTIRDFRLMINVKNGLGYVDGVSLKEISAAEKSSIYQFGTANWKNYNSIPVLEEMIIDQQDPANSSLHLVTANQVSGIEQVIKVEAGHTYELSYEALVQSGRVTPYMIIRGISKYTDFDGFVNPLYSYSHQDYTAVSRIFTVPEGSDAVYMRLVVAANSNVYFKNLVLREIDNDPFANDVVRDGAMDWLNTGLWTNIQTPAIKEKVGGALHIQSKPGYNYGIFERSLKNLEPNMTYELSFDVRVISGSVKPIIGNNSANSDFERSRSLVRRNANEEWVHYTDTFTTGGNAATPYSLLIFGYKGSAGNYAEAYIDNVSINVL